MRSRGICAPFAAELVGMALVDNPAYEDSIIAMRAAMVKVPKPRLRYQI